MDRAAVNRLAGRQASGRVGHYRSHQGMEAKLCRVTILHQQDAVASSACPEHIKKQNAEVEKSQNPTSTNEVRRPNINPSSTYNF